jgi:hypothetical protein
MNYDVSWEPEADAHFVQLWLRAADPERVMDAYDNVTRILAETPAEQGESRSSPVLRLWYHAPFELLFRIDEARREVDILEVRWVGE